MGRDWLSRRKRDPYYRAAKRDGLRSRAAFKILQIDDRFEILYEGDTVVDLGAAPGGWSQVCRGRVGDTGRVVAVDLVPMHVDGVEFLRGDIADPVFIESLATTVPEAHTVLSDVSPHLSGQRALDHLRSVDIVRQVFTVARRVLRPGGSLVAKVFQGEEFPGLLNELRREFGEVHGHTPKASVAESRETYIVAAGYGLRRSASAPAAGTSRRRAGPPGARGPRRG